MSRKNVQRLISSTIVFNMLSDYLDYVESIYEEDFQQISEEVADKLTNLIEALKQERDKYRDDAKTH